MSVRENIELYATQAEVELVNILVNQYGATKHPHEAEAYILDSCPFHAPQSAEDHIFILSFNNAPLPDSLIEALVDHPELFSDDTLVRWTQEQDLILDATLRQLRGKATRP